MEIIHDSKSNTLLPITLERPEIGEFLIRLQSTSSDEFINVSVPRIDSDLELVKSSSVILKGYQSNHWQDGEFSNLKTKIEGQSKSIGYIFPISTISEANSPLCDDQVASLYALAAIWELLKSSELQKEPPYIAWGETYTLSDFFRDDLIVAIYSTERINTQLEVTKQMISDFSITLADYKTYEYRNIDIKEKHHDDNFITERSIHLTPCSDDSKKPIFDYVKNHIAVTESTNCDPIVRFFLQYQFFELLMQTVFSGVIDEFRHKISNDSYVNDAWKTKELVSKLGEKTSESYRISRIFGFMLQKLGPETENINESCKLLLKKLESQKNADPKDYSESKTPYYKIRNLIFHGFASNSIEKNDISYICDAVAKAIYKLLLVFESLSPYFELENNET